MTGHWNGLAFSGSGSSFQHLPFSNTNQYSYGSKINEAGQVVGFTQSASGTSATLWSAGQVINLHNSNMEFSRANSINSAGNIVGVMSNESHYAQPVLWDHGSVQRLPTLNGRGGAATDINNSGLIVGAVTNSTDDNHLPVYWKDSNVFELASLGGKSGWATAVNSVGTIAGFSSTAGDLTTHAVTWTNGVATDLGTLAGGDYSIAFDINKAGTTVGRSTYGAGSATRATLWTGTEASDLNQFLDQKSLSEGWIFEEAVAINDLGQVVVQGKNSAWGLRQYYLLTPVPEPAVWQLMLAALGLGSLFSYRKRCTLNRPGLSRPS